jgi:hypothetical protein
VRTVTKIQKTLTRISALVALAAVSPMAAFAQNNTVNIALPTTSAFNSVTSWNATRLAGAAINLILIISGLVAFFFLLWGGLQWILAGGDKEGTEKARKRITAALIGLVIVFSVYALVSLASGFLGVELLNFTIINV